MRRIGLALMMVLLSAATAAAAEIKVMSAGAVQEALKRLADDFAHETGNHAEFSFATVGAIQAKLSAGEAADVVILSRPAIDAMEKAGALLPQSRAAIGRVGIGVAVRTGAALLDIATEDAFKTTLLAAPSIVYADPAKGASSGIYLAALFERMGIADTIKAKARLEPGGYVVAVVAQGGAALGLHNISEIIPVAGVTLVGPLPDAVQSYTAYEAAVTKATASMEASRAFVAFITRAAAGPRWMAAGIEPAGG